MITKKLTLFFLLFFSSQALLAQSAPSTNATSDETTLNNKLLDNAAQSQKIQDAKKPELNTRAAQGFGATSTTNGSPTNLTDQQKQLKENYIDQGQANRILKEKCVGEMAQACQGDEVDHKTLGMSPALIKIATQMYATMNAMGDFLPISKGSGESLIGKKTDKTADNPTPKDDDKPSDYCKFIPVATELYAQFAQSAAVKDIEKKTNDLSSPSGGGTSQKDYLLKAAKSHDSRASNAQIQAAGWFGGAACYAIKASTGAFAVDTALIVKLGASTFLGTFYQAEVAANKDYAKKTRDIANSLPGKGACNPITENACYCAEAEHENDTNFCKTQIAAKAAAASNTARVACTDDKLKIDPACNCEKSGSCFDKTIENLGGGDIEFGTGYGSSPFKPLASLARGKLESASINQSATNSSAIAKRALRDLASKVTLANNSLSPSQKEVANGLISQGIPSDVAKLMAQNAPSQSAIALAKAKLGEGGSDYTGASFASNKSNVLDFSGGNVLGVGGSRADKKNGMDDFLGKLNPAKATASNSRVLELAQKAELKASQITKSDRPLFEIISLRYQTSGRRLLQVEGSN